VRLLLVEDHQEMREMLQSHLEQVGFATDACANGLDALAMLGRSSYDVVILDLGLPDIDGMDVLRRIRVEIAIQVPILVLTARQTLNDRVEGLDAGADDYLLKPFDLPELDARLRSITRRAGTRSEKLLQFGDLSLDMSAREAVAANGPLALTRLEVVLLEELLRGGGHLIARNLLEERLYGLDVPRTGNALEALVSRLRRRLAVIRSDVGIETIRGIGYRLVVMIRAAG
jgi:DNA-binding response OmpR family regulator